MRPSDTDKLYIKKVLVTECTLVSKYFTESYFWPEVVLYLNYVNAREHEILSIVKFGLNDDDNVFY